MALVTHRDPFVVGAALGGLDRGEDAAPPTCA